VVYAHPTIASLVTFCTSSDINEGSDAEEQDEKCKAMLALVTKYTQDIPSFKPSSSTELPSDQAVIVVTGTTGSLGSNLLEALILSSAVAKIYALNRPSTSGDSLAMRQRRSFTERGLDDTLLGSEKVVLLEADLCEPSLGLHEAVLEEVASLPSLGVLCKISLYDRCDPPSLASSTMVCLCTVPRWHYGTEVSAAWRVDFNLALSSFEPSIKAIRILMDFALSTKLAKPPRLVFTSSVSVLRSELIKPQHKRRTHCP
jgi:NAD(P)-dependent dehydrogenase (short-subunit alcohol dehydrogenase family)